MKWGKKYTSRGLMMRVRYSIFKALRFLKQCSILDCVLHFLEFTKYNIFLEAFNLTLDTSPGHALGFLIYGCSLFYTYMRAFGDNNTYRKFANASPSRFEGHVGNIISNPYWYSQLYGT